VVHQPPRQALAALAVAKRSALMGLSPPQLTHHESIGHHNHHRQPQQQQDPTSQQQLQQQQQAYSQSQQQQSQQHYHHMQQNPHVGGPDGPHQDHDHSKQHHNNEWGLQGQPLGKESSLVMELQALAEEGQQEEGMEGNQQETQVRE
jgi:hypothetical protein